ncbi:SDR family NAD(P)-dependent oxidoreductase [Mycobacteroides abscessus]|uniref:SDR family NAD(P)-dependent oxidoreductase n=1 Tax=Mycobacteroides abscessus TaxID=36809 RepID=UPI0009A5EE75|nr:SDR family NAD(P)-dependent oxidoreductase [Mycobacteroides abscessus]SLF47779.1 short chain dehydrogenase [Mycobacteroides abscessus subsp. abscessus]
MGLKDTQKTWFITGATSGIGLALTVSVIQRSGNVIAVGRNLKPLQQLVAKYPSQLHAVSADVRDLGQIKDVTAAALDRFGRIDVVVNNAGYGLFGAVEEVSAEQTRTIFDINVFGAINVLRATLPTLRAQRSGHVLQASSYYGQSARAGVGMLAASKHAVEGLSEALAAELKPLGIHVTMYEPGPTTSGFLTNLHVGDPIADYNQTVRAVRRSMDQRPASMYNSPESVASAILCAVDAELPPLRLATGKVSVDTIRTSLQSRMADLDSWSTISLGVETSASETVN